MTEREIEQIYYIENYNSWFANATASKNNISILWDINDKGAINHILIAEFNKKLASEEVDGGWEAAQRKGRRNYMSYWPIKLYEIFPKSVGRENCWWPKANIYQVILDLFYQYGFATIDEQKRFLEYELKKIDILKQDIINHNDRRGYEFNYD